MTQRKGLGKGMGMGYKNIVQRDPYIHGLSAKGVKSSSSYMKPFSLKAEGDRVGRATELDTIWQLQSELTSETKKIKSKLKALKIQNEGKSLENYMTSDYKGTYELMKYKGKIYTVYFSQYKTDGSTVAYGEVYEGRTVYDKNKFRSKETKQLQAKGKHKPDPSTVGSRRVHLSDDEVAYFKENEQALLDSGKVNLIGNDLWYWGDDKKTLSKITDTLDYSPNDYSFDAKRTKPKTLFTSKGQKRYAEEDVEWTTTLKPYVEKYNAKAVFHKGLVFYENYFAFWRPANDEEGFRDAEKNTIYVWNFSDYKDTKKVDKIVKEVKKKYPDMFKGKKVEIQYDAGGW